MYEDDEDKDIRRELENYRKAEEVQMKRDRRKDICVEVVILAITLFAIFLVIDSFVNLCQQWSS